MEITFARPNLNLTDENRRVALMLVTGFFMGVFMATFQVTAESLFINKLGNDLYKAFIVAGVLGIISTSIFAAFQNVIRYSILIVASAIMIFGLCFTFYFLLKYGDPSWEKAVIFLMFSMQGPITAVLLLIYWGTFGRLFNFRQSKRIIGWIDTGQLIAAILASFVIPLTARWLPNTSDYLLICCGSLLVVAMLITFITTQFSLAKNDPSETEPEIRKAASITRLFSDKYILLLSLVILVSMTTFMLNQFSFQQTVREQYPDQRELTNFNAFFTGAVYGLSLLMQTFVNNKLIGNYGLRISLFLMPLVTGIFAFGALISGSIFGFNKTLSPVGFVYFFLFMALLRLFNWCFKDCLENPILKLFLIPMDSRLRFSIQSKVEGIVNEGARFISGLLIFVLGVLPFITVIHIAIIVIALSVLYTFMASNLYNGYRKKIRQKLEESEHQDDKLDIGFTRLTQRLRTMLSLPAPMKSVFSFKLLEKISASDLHQWVNILIKNDDEATRNYAQERLNELKGLSVSDRYVIKMDERVDLASRKLLSKKDLQLIIESGGDITKNRVQSLTHSTESHDRQYAAELLLHTSQDECISYLIELLNDMDTGVRNTAIKTAQKKYNEEVINSLIGNLSNPVYSNQAMSALVQIGGKALAFLESAFYRSNQNNQVMLRIVQTMGRIGGKRAQDLLWGKIDYPNKVVVSQVLLSLGECGFKAGISQVTRIKYSIEADIADIRWNLSAIQEIGSGDGSEELALALRDEIQGDIDHIYMLLAMLYDTKSIQLVKENIDSGTTEGITYAVELLDLFLSEQLKQRVIPVLDEISESERISKLDVFYPRIKLDSKLVLKFMINRDFTQSNRWTKALVLHQIGNRKIADFKLDLIAQLFNPDQLVSEVAAWALYQVEPREYSQNVRRLGEQRRKNLDEYVLESKVMSRFEMVLFYLHNSFFAGVSGLTISFLADLSTEVKVQSGQTLVLDDRSSDVFYFVVSGVLEYFKQGSMADTFEAGSFIGEMVSLPDSLNANLVRARENSRLLKVGKEQFYELLSDNVKLLDHVVEHV